MNLERFELAHPSGVNISGDLTERSLVEALPSAASSRRDMHTGWAWYRLPPFPEGDVIVSISLGFNSGRLEMLKISDMHPRHGSGDWSDWSEAKEQFRAKQIGDWLRAKGYTSDEYPWGSISVGYDERSAGGFASVLLRPNQWSERTAPVKGS